MDLLWILGPGLVNQKPAVQLQACTVQLNTVTVSKVVRKLMGRISYMDEDSIIALGDLVHLR